MPASSSSPRQQHLQQQHRAYHSEQKLRSSSNRSLLPHYAKPNRTKSLEFGMIEIFEFPVTVGDNPHVSSGCPIAMDPESEFRTIQQLDAYEKEREQKRQQQQGEDVDGNATTTNKKKTREQLKLSVSERAKLLLGAGYSINDIADATFEADTTKRLRAETNKQQKWDGVHAMMELTGRNLRKLLGQNKTSGGSIVVRSNSSNNLRVVYNNNNSSNKKASNVRRSSTSTRPQRRTSSSSQTVVVSPSA